MLAELRTDQPMDLFTRANGRERLAGLARIVRGPGVDVGMYKGAPPAHSGSTGSAALEPGAAAVAAAAPCSSPPPPNQLLRASSLGPP